MFSLHTSKLNICQEIGRDCWGTYHPYQKRESDNHWMVKNVLATSLELFIMHIQQIILSFSCDHPNILSVKGYCLEYQNHIDTWSIYMKFTKMEHSLSDILAEHMKKRQAIPETDLVKYFYGVVCGLRYLHCKKIAHAALRLENVLIDQYGRAKLANFGFERFCEEYSERNFSLQLRKIKKDLYDQDTQDLGIMMAELCVLKSAPEGSRDDKVEWLREELNRCQRDYKDVLIALVISLLDQSSPDYKVSLEDIQRRLQENYPELESKKKRNRDNNFEEEKEENINQSQVDMIRSELEDRWKNVFSFDKIQEQGLAIGVRHHEWVDEVEIRDLMKDLAKTVEGKSYGPLEGLSLDLRKCVKLKDEAVYELTTELGTNFKDLQHLSVNLNSCQHITGHAVKSLVSQVGDYLKNLRHLYLDFASLAHPLNHAIEELALQIGSNFKNLGFLYLNFSGCCQITDEAVKSLINKIGSSLENLHYLYLDFAYCYQITEETIKELDAQVQYNFPKLQFLYLNFVGCYKIPYNSIHELGEHIRSCIRNMRHFDIKFLKS